MINWEEERKAFEDSMKEHHYYFRYLIRDGNHYIQDPSKKGKVQKKMLESITIVTNSQWTGWQKSLQVKR